MICSQCGVEVSEEAVFCYQCGYRLAGDGGSEDARTRLQNAISDRGEDPPEDEQWQGQFSKRAMIGAWIGAGLFSVVLLVTAGISGFSGRGWAISVAIIACVWIGLLVRLFYRQLAEHYYLTNRRFIHERGLLWRVIDRIEAIDIDDVSYQQGPIERIMGVGTIQIRSSDTSHPEMELLGIENVKEVAEMIDEVRRQERHKRGLHIEAV